MAEPGVSSEQLPVPDRLPADWVPWPRWPLWGSTGIIGHKVDPTCSGDGLGLD
jgi:hypothetical protein